METKLYLLRPIHTKGDDPWEPWYDKSFGFVVRAESEESARQFADKCAGDENRGQRPWLEQQYSTCEVLTESGEAGVVIRDVHDA